MFLSDDLVVVEGHGNRLWKIDSHNQSVRFDNGKKSVKFRYRVRCVGTDVCIYADEVDLVLVCREAYSYQYLELLDKVKGAPVYAPTNESEIKTPQNIDSKYEKPLTKEETVDRILDEYSKLQSAKQELGELSDDMEASLHECKERFYKATNK
jgi:hypothetical protein